MVLRKVQEFETLAGMRGERAWVYWRLRSAGIREEGGRAWRCGGACERGQTHSGKRKIAYIRWHKERKVKTEGILLQGIAGLCLPEPPVSFRLAPVSTSESSVSVLNVL